MTASLRLYILLTLTALFCASVAARAQHPRQILIEEGTNASCEPCAWQNLIFEEFLDRDDVAPFVIPLVYHAYWPGPDTMNLRAPEMNDARIRGYYGMFGMPSVVVNGQGYPSATPGLGGSTPADTIALRRRIDSLRTLTSPIVIDIVDAIEGNALTISTRVTSDAAFDASLRVAVVERHHFYPWPTAGNNGEEHFPWTVRAMLPDAAGRRLVLAADGTATFFDTVEIDPEWNREELYVVAFIQRDDTRDVLQAASTRARVRITPGTARALRVTSPDTGAMWTAGVVASLSGNYRVTLEQELPPQWSATVVIDSAVMRTGESITLDSGVSSSLAVTIVPAPQFPGKGVVRVIISGDRGAIDTVEYRAYAGTTDVIVLAWHAANRPDVSELFDDALARTDYEYLMVHPDDDGLFRLTDHRLVVVAAGDDSLDASRRARLREFLDARGRLLISGSQISQSLGDPEMDQNGIPRDTSFLHNYLHASFVSPTSATLAVNGIRNDPIGSNIGFTLSGGRWPVGSPERVRPRRNALPVFHYGSSKDAVGAIRYGRPEHRVVFLAFGAEAIADTTVRAAVLERSIRWLLGADITADVQSEWAAVNVRAVVSPHPVRDRSTLDITLTANGRATIYSALGELMRREDLVRGDNRISIDAATMAAGVYVVVVETDGQRTLLRFIVQ